MDNNPNIGQILQKIDKLPTIPAVAAKILKAIKDENKNINDLAQILTSDAPMSAEILKLINSPLYGLPNRVNSLPFAINLLGFNTIKYTALSFSIMKNFRKKSKDKNYTNLWKESILAAVACRIIAEETAPEIKEDMFAMGLLHDMGRLVLWENMTVAYSVVLFEQNRNSKNRASLSLHDLEMKTLGFSHTIIGSALMEKWGFPSSFYDAIKYHHSPDLLPSDVSEETKVCTTILSFASLIKDFFTLKNKNKIWKDIESYADSSALISREQLNDVKACIDEESRHLFSIFEIDHDYTGDYYADMIETARNELIKITDDIFAEFREQQKVIDNLTMYANYDELTGLYNYRRFYEAYDLEITRLKRYNLSAVLILADIDFFKAVNDTYGHMAGDMVIKKVAETLLCSLREADIVCRYGGEEFAIILPETNAVTAVQTAERLREAVKNLEIDHEGRRIKVTMSFGVKNIVSKNLNADCYSYIHSADEALYKAKRSGRNQVVVADD